MKPAAILISGAGQLGSRYLQGLASCSRPLDIHVHDIDRSSLERAEGRWLEVAQEGGPHQVTLHDTVAGLPTTIDLAIVASTSQWRPQLVAELSGHARVHAWILEKILAQSEAGLDEIARAVGTIPTWVNTPRRMLAWHQQIKKQLGRGKPLHLTVTGGSWGLACNAIHFLDMFDWWAGESITSFDTTQLAPKWIESKRPGNFEIMGTLQAHFDQGSTATLSASEGDVFYKFELHDGAHRWAIDEAAGTAVRSDGFELPGRLPFLSEVSGALVESILAGKGCELPTLQESLAIHRPYLRALLVHWQQHMDDSALAVPIT